MHGSAPETRGCRLRGAMRRLLSVLVLSARAWAGDECNVCLYTPPETSTLHTGKGGSTTEEGTTQKLAQPLFTGELFYVVDGGEKQPLPKGKGVFFVINDKKKHVVSIVDAAGKPWSRIPLDCSEYATGTKLQFKADDFYSPGWKATALPKDGKCPFKPK